MLRRVLTLKDAYMLIVGNIVGIGIFTTTGYISNYVHNASTMLGLWILGGLLSFFGALTYSELSTRFPRAGGDFHYLTNAFNPILGFLFGWSALFVTYTGSISVIAVGFGYYFLNFFPVEIQQLSWTVPGIYFKLSLLKFVAIVIAFIFTYINVRGVKLGANWQRIFTIGSILTLVFYIIIGLISSKGSWFNFQIKDSWNLSIHSIPNIGEALIGIYFTYSGWTILAYVAGEIENPSRNIPIASFVGVVTVAILYFLMNVTYIYALPVHEMSNMVDIGFQVLRLLWGQSFSYIVTIIISIAIISTLNSTILSGSRIYYAMSREGQFFKRYGQLHERFETPANALWIQFFWSSILIISGSFNQLLTYTVFVMVAFGFLSALGLIFLRNKNESIDPPYLAWGYPLTTFIYMGFTLFIMINTLIKQPLETISGIILVAIGLPFYFYFSKKKLSGKT
jgi:APA family basic amino acid/polyamine antiporter